MTQQTQTKQIPKGWKELSFPKCFKSITPTYKIKKSNYLEKGLLSVVDQGEELIGGYIDDNSKKQETTLPVIIFGDHTRRFKFVNFNFVAGADGIKILQINDFIDPKFAYYQTLTLKFPNKGYSRHFQYINKTNIFYPESKEEQTLIVQEIEKQFTRLDAAVKSLKSVKQKLEIYRKAVLKKAFEKKEGWGEKTLKEVCEKITDGAHYTPKYVNEGYPFITVKNRKNNQIDFDSVNKISEEDFLKLKKNDCNPKRGDVLFSKDGTVGEVIKIDYEKAFIVLSSWAILRPSEKITQNYLYWLMRSPNTFNQAINLKTGTAIRRIVLRNLKEVNIQFPISKEEQAFIVQEIESKFSVIDKIEQVIEESLKKAEKLRKSILKSAFEGKLVKMEGVEE